MDELGKQMFGRTCRLALAMWIARRDKPRFFQSEPPKDVTAPSSASDELGRLVRLGMLEEERPDGERRVYYVRAESPLWKIIEAASDCVEPE